MSASEGMCWHDDDPELLPSALTIASKSLELCEWGLWRYLGEIPIVSFNSSRCYLQRSTSGWGRYIHFSTFCAFFWPHSTFLTGVRSLVCGVDSAGIHRRGPSQRQIARYKHSSVRHHIHLCWGDISQNIPLLYIVWKLYSLLCEWNLCQISIWMIGKQICRYIQIKRGINIYCTKSWRMDIESIPCFEYFSYLQMM